MRSSEQLVSSGHLVRKAVIYVRQSTSHQVHTNRESLKLQYTLKNLQRPGRSAKERAASKGKEGHPRDHPSREQGRDKADYTKLRGGFGAKWPKAVAEIEDEEEEALLAFYDFPAEHRVH